MIQIRNASIDDLNSIVEFQMAMAFETEGIHLDKNTLTEGVKAVFSKPELGQYFVAAENDSVVASMLITYECSDWRNSMVWWLQSVYVLPAFRKRGIFNMLYDLVKALIEEKKDVSGIRLYVAKSNIGAARVYNNVGMDNKRYDVFEWMKDY